jgi:hypothetical protein
VRPPDDNHRAGPGAAATDASRAQGIIVDVRPDPMMSQIIQRTDHTGNLEAR